MIKALPVFMLLLGIAAGVGAGYVLQAVADPGPDVETLVREAEGTGAATTGAAQPVAERTGSAQSRPPEYIGFNNQFVIPIVSGDIVTSLVVLSLGIEIDTGQAERVYTSEPKLRDGFLQVLFDHANMGGFRGRFTDGGNMDVLRRSLTEVAQSILGPGVRGVMITDIARQDV